MKCLIIDDNALARLSLQKLLSFISGIEVIGECSSAAEGYNFLKNTKVDLLMLDVEMPEMTGIELMRSLEDKPMIIFTTAENKYASEVFELNVVDYLVKPYTLPRLIVAIEKAEKLYELRALPVQDSNADFLFIKENRQIIKINKNEIEWLEAKGDYVKIQAGQRTHLVHTTMKNIEDKLQKDEFFRVHRGFIIRLDKIDSISDSNQVIIGNASIPLGEKYKSDFMAKLNIT